MRETIVVNKNLQELRSSGYEIAKSEPDIRGWKVVDSHNVQIGKIKELLFDRASRKVRYLVVDLDGKPINLLSRDIIIPIGLAELDATENVVFFPDVTVGHLATLPEYEKGKVTYKIEKEIRDVFIPESSAAADRLADYEAENNPEREAFYNNEYYDDSRMYKRRKLENKLKNEEDNARYIPAETNERINEKRNVEEDVIYIPDEKDPSVLRKAKIVKEVHHD